MIELLPDRIVYEVTLFKDRGVIPLKDISAFEMEDTRRSAHLRARKYRNARVLALHLGAEDVRLIVLPEARASGCEKALSERTELGSRDQRSPETDRG